ncbi:F-box/kelch-repeat protein At3g06240-like isoform X1 [Quercus lobata]|uniref:F-box domain-containing protein n=1 Tax=Quercus lobata TaxID=97700 RepID=A0A7N2M281_QUELO|nr:F-box/kelch-repeat protein At3g06240-like isoform X1 [Quercus lobata]
MSDSKKSIRWGYLPDEILTRIFTFLPIKSVIICTTVSKTWKSLIKNPTFISTHLHHSRNQNQNLFLLLSLSRNDKQVYTLHKEDDDPDFTEYTSFDSPAPALHLHNVVGTFNGLICLSYGLPNRAEEIFLWNPCVRKFLQLPYPDATVDTHGTSHTSFGFGFDPKTNDYKVVRILSIHGGYSDFVKSRLVVEVYSLFASEWRMLSLPPICAKIRIGRATFANGALHWIAFTNDDKQFVLVFDLGDEVFREILLPEFPGQVIWTGLSVYGNSIAGFRITVGIDEKVQINICVMKEYGVASSWTPFFTADFEFVGPTPRPIGFRRNGDAVFVLGKEKLVCWNPESKEFKDLRMIGDHDPFIDSYIESLVLLDKAANVAVTY